MMMKNNKNKTLEKKNKEIYLDIIYTYIFIVFYR